MDSAGNTTHTLGLQLVACHLCGHQDSKIKFQLPARKDQVGLYGRDVWDIVQCNHCNLIYVNPQPDKEALAHYYQFDNVKDQEYLQRWFLDNEDLQRPTWLRYLRTMTRHSAPGKLLDVGCGAGSFLIEARKIGYDVYGQEVSPFFVAHCSNIKNLPVFEGELETLPFEPASFDYVTTFDVIEHHPNPQQLVETMHALLKEDGLLVIGTHDIGNIFARWYGKRWRYVQPVGHLTYFSRTTLCRLLENSGFKILHVGGIHTVDATDVAEYVRMLTQFVRVILVRLLIVGIYRPLTKWIPRLSRWRLKIGSAELTHEKLLTRAGTQIIMNDNMLILAVKRCA